MPSLGIPKVAVAILSAGGREAYTVARSRVAAKVGIVGYALGIDLGTSATAAAIADEGRIEMLDLGAQGGTMPSLVLLREDGEALVGEAAERRASADPSRLARAF
jgi:Ethanolamine utilization protein EutJ (predicted chaperonin)